MTFLQAVKSGFRNYIHFTGRASRSEFWYWQLFIALCSFVVVLPTWIVFETSSDADLSSMLSVITSVQTVVLLAFNIAILLPTVGVFMRRLHDVNRRGWWLLIYCTIVGIIPLIIWFCRKGTKGKNRFGDDPLA